MCGISGVTGIRRDTHIVLAAPEPRSSRRADETSATQTQDGRDFAWVGVRERLLISRRRAFLKSEIFMAPSRYTIELINQGRATGTREPTEPRRAGWLRAVTRPLTHSRSHFAEMTFAEMTLTTVQAGV
jgi:hypothetical protein